jgi:hypothetical protein
MGAPCCLEPLGEGQQISRHRPKGADRLDGLPMGSGREQTSYNSLASARPNPRSVCGGPPSSTPSDVVVDEPFGAPGLNESPTRALPRREATNGGAKGCQDPTFGRARSTKVGRSQRAKSPLAW